MLSKDLKRKVRARKSEGKVIKFIRRNSLYIISAVVIGVVTSSLLVVSANALSKVSLDELKPTELTESSVKAENINAKQASSDSEDIDYFYKQRVVMGYKVVGKTALGTTPKEGRTLAVNPSDIPLGSKVNIDGVEYIAEDTVPNMPDGVVYVYSESGDAKNSGELVDLFHYMN